MRDIRKSSRSTQKLIANLDGSERRVLARRKDPEFFLIYPAGPAWSPDGKAVAYINDIGGVSNIWIQPLDGGEAKQLTRYQAHRIEVFDWSPDGKLLVLARAVESGYVALITDTK